MFDDNSLVQGDGTRENEIERNPEHELEINGKWADTSDSTVMQGHTRTPNAKP